MLQVLPYDAMVRLKIQTDDPRLEDDLRSWKNAPSVRSKSSGS